METKINYALVGIFVTILLTAIIIIGVWLATGIETQSYKYYQVYMNESVAGLTDNAPVKFNGVTVGSVEDIKLNLTNPQQVILTLGIDPNTPITETTRAILIEQGITGIAYVGLKAGKKAPLLTTKPGRKYPIIASSPSFLVKLDKTIESLSDNVTHVSQRINFLLNDKNLEAIQATLQHIKIITAAVSDNEGNIRKSMQDLQILLKHTAAASNKLPQIMTKIDRSLDGLHRLNHQLTLTSENATQFFEQGNIALRTFSNSVMPETYDTLHQLKETSENFSRLSSEIAQNPAMLLRGKAPSRPGPGE